jgi:hypothetical protein
MTRLFQLVLIATTLAAGNALAETYQLKSLTIEQPFARATPPAATVGGVFMTIRNRGAQADRLVRVASPAAGLAEMHEMKMEGDVMQMRAVPGIEIKPGATVELKPSGLHVMLQQLKRPLKQGETVSLALTFEKAGTVEIMVPVESMAAMESR